MELSVSERAWLWLSESLGTAISLIDRLVYSNGDVLNAFDTARSGRGLRLPSMPGYDELLASKQRTLYEKCSDGYLDTVLENYAKKGVRIVTRDSRGYPDLLREIYDPPTVLFVKGNLPERIDLPVAVIGSRKSSDYGRRMAQLFGRALAENGACVVSGMALGCDSEAAWGALEAPASSCPTVAVLGGGVDVVYPRTSYKLYNAILERGALISEMRPGSAPTRQSFPQRNRLISGMSKGVLVVEAGEKSGTRITVDFALEQGREVFAVPAKLTDMTSAGSNALIKNGEAKPVFGVDDILSEFGTFTAKADIRVKQKQRPELPPAQLKLYDLLLLGEKTRDELSDLTGRPVSEINILLTEMELSGIIRQLPNGEYALGS